MTEHPINPSTELVLQWLGEYFGCTISGKEISGSERFLVTRAAQWGADQELEACCKLLELSDDSACEYLRAARRKPPSLKEQALQELDKVNMLWATEEFGQETLNSLDTIRKALEALPSD